MKYYSKKTMDSYYDEFGVGKRTLLDLINVENDYNNARQSYEAARYDLMLFKFRILEAMGGLVEYFTAKADMLKLPMESPGKEVPPVLDILKGIDQKLGSRQPVVAPSKEQQDIVKKLNKKESGDDELDDELKFLQEAIDKAGGKQ